jgi:WD40 repeat protein
MQAYSLKNLISSSNDGTLRIWDLKERKQIKSFNAHSGPLSDFVLSNELVTVG